MDGWRYVDATLSRLSIDFMLHVLPPRSQKTHKNWANMKIAIQINGDIEIEFHPFREHSVMKGGLGSLSEFTKYLQMQSSSFA